MSEQRPLAATGLGFLDRFRTLAGAWRELTVSLGAAARFAPDLPPEDAEALGAQMRDCLAMRGGEVSARARAAALGRVYAGLSAEGRGRFLHLLAAEFGPEPALVATAIDTLAKAQGTAARFAAEQDLRKALTSPRRRLLAQFVSLPEGVKFLVDMRHDLLERLDGDPAMGALDAEFRELLAGWFDVGFLELERVTWRSPASLLEKIMAYEAVHAIRGWRDLKNRLDSDRRLYAFFHPRMPDEPLIFVEVALVKGMAGSVQDLLDEHAPVGDPAKADSAIFYSINNAQKGLVGISFGNFLIKRVVDRLSHDFPNLKTFATLSPIPGFRSWLDSYLGRLRAEGRAEGEDEVAAILAGPWHQDPNQAQILKGALMRLCARYLAEEKGRGGRASDPVAHFHLTNGARMERINWMADLSPKGVAQSAGMMVNYFYKLSEIEANHEAYRGQGRIAISASVRSLVRD